MVPSATLTDKLHAIARNLRWSWAPEVRTIFRDLDAQLYREVHHNPVAFLKRLSPAVIDQRAGDLELAARIDRSLRLLREYLAPEATWGLTHAGALHARPVAYFCAEFGIHESIPLYSGGLGILAGDHLKAASDLGIPLVGVGLLYHQGYVRQELDRTFWQQDVVEPFDLNELPVSPALDASGTPVRVHVDLPGRRLWARVLEARVGRVRLLLMDARDDANTEADRAITARLYGGDKRTRIQQEMVLGIGGVRALAALGIRPSVVHMNEGHCVFALLERARERMVEEGLGPWEALREVGAAAVFTTHTPVEAGHDFFPADLAGEHLAPMASLLRLSVPDLLGLGRARPDDLGSEFCPTILALRLSLKRNAVSALHGRVARRMWKSLFPGRTEDEVPIGHITNGVHASTWVAPDVEDLFARFLGPDWLGRISRSEAWQKVDDIEDGELWELHRVLKARTLAFVGRRLEEQRKRRGETQGGPPPLDPDILTIGFARRFATYKRATLLLDDAERLLALVTHKDRPVQIVFAGRAHPHDEGGKRFIQRIAQLENDPVFRGRVVFIENHNMHVGRQLTSGLDCWLNMPRRPLEACGTSGMKAILNGALNISILDGWWAEAFDGENGFAIGSGAIHIDPAEQDRRDREATFQALENEVAPLFYERNQADLPRRWLGRVRRALRTLAWRFNGDRMLMDYVRTCYLPAAGASSAEVP